jgi:hypothetical protein
MTDWAGRSCIQSSRCANKPAKRKRMHNPSIMCGTHDGADATTEKDAASVPKD